MCRKSIAFLFGFTLVCVAAARNAPAQGQGGGGGVLAQGVYVDAEGVLRTVVVDENADRLKRLRKENSPGASGAVAKKTPLRKISLSRVARELSQCMKTGEPIPDELRYLAGIQQIQYVFVYPEERDVVIAGPAEGWQTDSVGRVIGQGTRRPVVRLDDLIVALRVFPPGGASDTVVGCTINQTEEGVRRLNQYLASLGRIDPRRVDASIVRGVRDSLGLQNIEVWGVPSDSHLGMVLVEADYRMKLIGMGLEDPRVRGLTSFVSLLGPGDGGASKLQRWWFVPDYEAIIETDGGLAFELRGQRAKLLASDDRLKLSGEVERLNPANASGTTKRFAQSFTSHYAELARVSPIYAEMQNAFDLVILAALIQERDLVRHAPDLGYFYDADGYSYERFPTPKFVESVVNTKWIGNKLAIPVGGGVVVEPAEIIKGGAVKSSTDAKLRQQRQSVRGADVPKDRWWID